MTNGRHLYRQGVAKIGCIDSPGNGWHQCQAISMSYYVSHNVTPNNSQILDTHGHGGTNLFFLHYEVADQMEQPIVDLLVAHCLHWENVSLEVPGIAIRGLLKIEA